MSPLSVRTKLVLWNSAILAGSLAISAIAVQQTVRRRLVDDLDRQNLATVRGSLLEELSAVQPSSTLVTPSVRDGRGRHSGSSEEDSKFKLTVVLHRYTKDGQFVSSSDSTDGGGAIDLAALKSGVDGNWSASDSLWRGGRWRVITLPLSEPGRPAGIIQVARPEDGVDNALRALNEVLLTLSPLALIMAALGGMFLTRKALRPVENMARESERIEASTLSQRLPVATKDELGRLATSFNKMLARLEKSFESQRRFTADAAHELRTPLTSIKANTSLAISGDPTLEECLQALHKSDRAADTMSHLVDDLLLLSRSDAGQLELRPQRVDLGALIDDVCTTFEAQAKSAGVELAAHADLVVTTVDPLAMERVLVNLVSNALRHTPEGGRVDLDARVSDGHVVLTVSDTGEGISPEHLPHLFDRFYRVDDARTRSAGGVGLGLAICRTLVERMGGTILVNSTVGSGTIVTVNVHSDS